jgi:DNA topoisomerase III
MKLFICEKPSQAKDIAPFVGASNRGNGSITGTDVTVTWCIGHLLEQASMEDYDPALKTWSLDTLPFVPDSWRMYVKKPVESQFRVVRDLLKTASEVVIATDADREGEVIAREVMAHCGYRGAVSRLWLSALDAASVKKALAKPKTEAQTRNLYFSGLGRARADWLMGMNMTRGLTTAFSARGALHCGRVQTPVLGLIVRRERAILTFVSKPFFTLDARFQIQGSLVPMNWAPSDASLAKLTRDADGRCLVRAEIEAVASKIKDRVGRVTGVATTPKAEKAPMLYYLGSLQKEASARFGIKATQVLDACQSLYEKHKATTYPRTDCENLPTSMFGDVPAILQALVQVDPAMKPIVAYARVEQPGRVFNDSKVTAHHAIIPTANTHVHVASMTKIEAMVYELIRRRFVAQFMGDHKYAETLLNVVCEGEAFSKTGKTTTEPGWLRAEPKAEAKPKAAGSGSAKSEEAAPELVAMPSTQAGDQALNVHAECVSKKTEPPKRYTEGTLISAMESIDKEIDDPRMKAVMRNKEKAGIGTDATRADTIEKLLSREYIVTDKKYLKPTEKGIKLIELLEQVAPGVVDPVLTALWEDQLAQVEAGKLELKVFESELANWLGTMIDGFKAKAGSVQIAGSDKNGKSSSAKVSGSTREYKAESGPQCPGCGKGHLRSITGARGVFWGCSGYRDGCKATYADFEGKPQMDKPATKPSASGANGSAKAFTNENLNGQPCPTCGSGTLSLRNLKDTGKQFWGCSGFPECRHFVWAK